MGVKFYGKCSAWMSVVAMAVMYSKNPKGYLLDRGVITLFSFLPGAKVVNQKTYHYSYEQKNMTEKLVQKILQASTVVPSSSPFASLVILIKKKDASWRIYVDYRQLNDIMVKNKYPIPVVEDLLDELHGANLFSKLDLRSAYRQIRMCEEDEFKTAFRTHHGLWQFWVMPFGLSNSLKTFQAIMHKNEEATQAFEALKQAMIQAPISALPDFTKHFVMEVYACGSGVDIKEFVSECDNCQKNKGENVAYPGLLQPLHIPSRACEHITMDFIEGLPQSGGKKAIFVVVDRYTKYAHFLALSHPYTTVAEAKLSIVSDRDPIFVSLFWKELFKGMGVQIKLSSAYHLQTDEQTKRLNRCLEGYLHCMMGHKQTNWSKWLSLAEFCYNSTYYFAIQMSPFNALYGYDPHLPTFELVAQSKENFVDEMLKQRRIMSKVLQENIKKAQERMKLFADSKEQREFLKKGIGKVGNPTAALIDPLICNNEGQILVEPVAILDRCMVKKKKNKAATEVLVQWANLSSEEATWEDINFLRS
ncbi:uncharacterized protein LOC142165924 [Nicotiana tabacum]|uniref:Uncharacterized protein LOC142165924 n=1 Tax=Nicotiana tabacum TaxID=4097 RepID=A0AC58S648_TOBAC